MSDRAMAVRASIQRTAVYGLYWVKMLRIGTWGIRMKTRLCLILNSIHNRVAVLLLHGCGLFAAVLCR